MGGLASRSGKRLDTPERAAGATRSLAGRVARARALAQPPWLSEPPRAFGYHGWRHVSNAFRCETPARPPAPAVVLSVNL